MPPPRFGASASFSPFFLAIVNYEGVVFSVGRPRPAWRFEPMTCACLIVVRKRTIKWVLSRREFYRDVVASVGRIRVVKTAVISCPLFVPGTCAIWDGIISAWLFADPKDSCYDTFFPRIPPCRPRTLRSKGGIKCDEERARKKTERPAILHHFFESLTIERSRGSLRA